MTKMLLFSLPSRDPIYSVSTVAFDTLYLQQNTALVISIENPLYCASQCKQLAYQGHRYYQLILCSIRFP